MDSNEPNAADAATTLPAPASRGEEEEGALDDDEVVSEFEGTRSCAAKAVTALRLSPQSKTLVRFWTRLEFPRGLGLRRPGFGEVAALDDGAVGSQFDGAAISVSANANNRSSRLGFIPKAEVES